MLLSDLEFGSYLTYSPRGETSEILKSRNVTYSLKQDKIVGSPPRETTRYLAEALAMRIDETPLQDLLGPEIMLIPAPKSSLLLPSSLWVPKRIANALVEVGLGKEVLTIIERIRAVPRAASVASVDRPIAQTHYETISVHLSPESIQRMVIVDDVITRGATMLGAASRLAETYPEAEIRGFAMIRTISNPEEFREIENPCMGDIQLRDDQTFRNP